MSTLPEQVQIECIECGVDIIEDIDWVLEVGSENIICEDCYEAEQEGYRYPDPEIRGTLGPTKMILEVAKWLVLPFFILMLLEGILPFEIPLMAIPIWGFIGGAYVMYLGYTEDSWIASGIGLYVLGKSAILLFQIL